LPQTKAGVIERRLVGRETHTYAARRYPAEGRTVHDGDSLGGIQRLHELCRAETGTAHIDEHEHSGFRRQRLEAGDAGDTGGKACLACAAIGAHASLGIGGEVECSDGCLLDESRQPEQHAHGDVLGVHGELARANQPAGAPAGHGVRLRQAAERHHLIRQTCGQAWYPPLGCEARVHLIRDQPQVVTARQLGDHAELLLVEHDSARVVRARPQERARARPDEPGERRHIGAARRGRGGAHQART